MEDQKKIQTRLKRIEGQIRGIHKMIEEEKDSELVLQQISAARAALFKAGLMYAARDLDESLVTGEECTKDTKERLNAFISYFLH